LILLDRLTGKRRNFYPLALSRPVWELRCGMTSLGEKLLGRLRPSDVACFVPPYLAAVYRRQTAWPVNDAKSLLGDDLLLVDGRVKAAALDPAAGASQVALDSGGDVLWARIAQADLGRLQTDSLDGLLDAAKQVLPRATLVPAQWNYTWELVLANAGQLVEDFRAAGRRGLEGTVEQPAAIRGSRDDLYIAPGAVVHPMVVLDAEHGPIYIDEGAEIHPFSRIEGPCYIGRKSLLLGAKCRRGNSIGPACRVGGEVEESIIQGDSNKYHDGFLGHAYVGQWVNLGALTTNSDLKNDYSSVSVVLDGRTPVDTGSMKVGALIGDHAKTSIGTLLNTGAYVGAMTLIATAGKLLPKFIPSFAWFIEGALSEGFGKPRLYQAAKTALGRRGRDWTDDDRHMWDAVFSMTAAERDAAIQRAQRR
jgi:UDP-N-acetylglucosamine diphosphorylase/glucosamine-1-phosphate N-acetyltransferase